MTVVAISGPERDQISALLPWYAAGTLSRSETARVEAAVTRDAALSREYDVVCAELAETIRLNENLGAPGTAAGRRLMRAIDAEETRVPQRSSGQYRLGTWLSGLSPRVLAWSATTAAFALILQGALIAGLGPYTLSSVDEALPSHAALVTFAPQATLADITKYLHAHRAHIVEGPRGGGIYKIRVETGALSRTEVAEIIDDIQQPNDVVRFIGLTK